LEYSKRKLFQYKCSEKVSIKRNGNSKISTGDVSSHPLVIGFPDSLQGDKIFWESNISDCNIGFYRTPISML
jgi:hypothetical protein